MTGGITKMTFGWRVYGLGAMALAMLYLAWGSFAGQSVPKDFPCCTALAYAAGAFMLVAGAAVEWRRTAWAAAALTAYYALIVIILIYGRVYASFTLLVHASMLLADPSNHYIWTEDATNLVLTGVAWVVADSLARPRR